MNIDKPTVYMQSLYNGCVEVGQQPPDMTLCTHFLRLLAPSQSWANETRVRFDVPGRIRVVATSPVGSPGPISNWIVIGTENGLVHVHDVHTGAPVRNELGALMRWQAHDGWVMALSVNKAGEIATAGWDGRITVWQPQQMNNSAERERYLWTGSAHAGPVNGVSYSPEGDRLASVGADGKLIIWAPAESRNDARPLLDRDAHDGWAKAIAWVTDNLLVTGGTDHSLNLWEIEPSSTSIFPMDAATKAHSQEIRSIAVGTNARLATGSRDKSVALWKVSPDKKLIQVWRGLSHTNHVNSVCFCGENTIASASDDRSVLLWPVNARLDADGFATPLCRLPVHEHFVSSVAYHNATHQIVSAGLDRTVTVMSASSRPEPPNANCHADWMECVVVGENRVISGGNDRMVKVWEFDSSKALVHLWEHEHKDWVNAAAWSPVKPCLLAVGSSDGMITVWDISNPDGHKLMYHRGHAAWITSVAWSPNGQMLASGSGDTMVGVWSPFEPEPHIEIWREKGHEQQVNCCSFSYDGKRLSSGSKDRITVWDVKAMQPIWQGLGEVEGRTVAWGEGNQLASGSYDGRVKIWEVGASPKPTLDIQIGAGEVRALQWSNSKSLLAAGTDDRTVVIVDPFTGDIRYRFYSSSGVLSLYFTPDDKQLHIADNGGGTGVPRVYRLGIES